MALPVEQLMTSQVKTCSPEDAIVELMEVMTLQRIRHLPVVRNAALEGIVSIGDVVKQRLQRSPARAEGATQLPLLVLEGTASDLRVMIAGERRSGDVDAEHHHVPRQ